MQVMFMMVYSLHKSYFLLIFYIGMTKGRNSIVKEEKGHVESASNRGEGYAQVVPPSPSSPSTAIGSSLVSIAGGVASTGLNVASNVASTGFHVAGNVASTGNSAISMHSGFT
jgi:hypothetical protein